MDIHSTHLFALSLAINKFGKRVLEIGTGYYSTLLIHGICGDQAISLEDNANWHSTLYDITKGNIILVENIVEASSVYTDKKWDIVFIDCFKAEDRISIASMFVDRTVLVLHDTEAAYWKEFLQSVKHCSSFNKLTPQTSWVSNVVAL